MNILLIGRNKIAIEQLSHIADNMYLVFDKSFDCQRSQPEFDKYPILFSRSNVSTILGVLPRAKEIIGWIKQYDIDVVYTNTKWDMLAAKIASLFCRNNVVLISTSHNSYAWQNKRSVKLMSILIQRTTDVYLSLASFVYNALLDNGVKKERLLLLPNTINSEAWEQKTDYDCEGNFKIAYVAYVYPAKRQDFLLDVLNTLSQKYSVEVDCYGDIDGYPDYVHKIKEEAQRINLSDRFHFCGRIENEQLRSRLKNYDLYFCPSDMEMSPVNILEAQAVGLPVMASDVGGIPDVIRDGETGLLYESGNVHDAVEKLVKLIENKKLRERLGKAGREYVTSIYSPKCAGCQIREAIIRKLNKNS